MWCGRRESNPHGLFEPCGFSLPSTAFAARMQYFVEVCAPVCGLDYPFTLSRKIRGLGAARLVSTPSRPNVSPGLARDCHIKRFPRL
jgi:hypothetical protein